jgi:hypothetical protein
MGPPEIGWFSPHPDPDTRDYQFLKYMIANDHILVAHFGYYWRLLKECHREAGEQQDGYQLFVDWYKI